MAEDLPLDGPPLTVVLTQALDEVSRRVEEVTSGEGLSLEQWLVLRRLAAHGDQACVTSSPTPGSTTRR